MGVLNATPDSFSGDGLLAAPDPVAAAVDQARRMVAEGADLLDVGGASSRPGHTPVPLDAELARVVPVVRAVAAALPGTPISVDTTVPAVAEAALDAGAHLLNDVWGVADDPAMVRLAAARGVPIVLMHNRAEARYRDVVAEVVADLQAALERALAAGVAWDALIVDPGFGFGKTPDHNLALLAGLGGAARPRAARSCWAPRASRRSAGCSTCRPTSGSRRRSRPRCSASRRAPTSCGSTTSSRTSAPRGSPTRSLRGWRPAGWATGARDMTDRIVLDGMVFQGTHGVYPRGAADAAAVRGRRRARARTSSRRACPTTSRRRSTTAGSSRPAARSSSPRGST